ncbi:EthD domain-containing protein [Mycolicibacterium sp. CBM1]
MLKVTILLTLAGTQTPDDLTEQRLNAAPAIVERLQGTDGAMRYAQSVRLPSAGPIIGDGSGTFAGTEEYWFDTAVSARRFFAHPNAAGLENQPAVDVPAARETAGMVHPIWDTAPGEFKVIVLGTRKPSLTVQEYRHHWITVHGPLAMGNPEGRDARGRVEYCPADVLRLSGLQLAPFDSSGSIGVTGGLEDFGKALTGSYYRDVLRPDELRFTDTERTAAMIVREYYSWGTLPVTR